MCKAPVFDKADSVISPRHTASWKVLACITSMTSHIICDVTTTLLKYSKYIEKLKLTARAAHMQITMIFIIYMCK